MEVKMKVDIDLEDDREFEIWDWREAELPKPKPSEQGQGEMQRPEETMGQAKLVGEQSGRGRRRGRGGGRSRGAASGAPSSLPNRPSDRSRPAPLAAPPAPLPVQSPTPQRTAVVLTLGPRSKDQPASAPSIVHLPSPPPSSPTSTPTTDSLKVQLAPTRLKMRHLPPLEIRATLPEDYPEKEPPQITLMDSVGWMADDRMAELEQRLNEGESMSFFRREKSADD